MKHRVLVIVPLLFCFLLLNGNLIYSQNESLFEGMALDEALRHLQMLGLNILYSSDLVLQEMKVNQEPESKSPRQILNQLLQPHGLKVLRGPGDTLLVVRDYAYVQAHGLPKPKETKRDPGDYMVVPFVTVYFTAQDSKNRFVTDLKAQDFVLREDRVELPITEFVNYSHTELAEQNKVPLTVVFLLDSSHSMVKIEEGMRRFDYVKQAAVRLLDEFRPQDQMMILGFNEASWIINDMTGNTSVIKQKLLEQDVAGGRTAVFDAMMKALLHMQEFSGRKVIVLCSDGEDNVSQTPIKKLITVLESSNVTVFAFGTNPRSDVISATGRKTLEKITELTGGHSFFSSAISDLNVQMDQVRTAMRSQYAAGYAPPNPLVHKWRQIELKCKVPDIKLRYRKTYLF